MHCNISEIALLMYNPTLQNNQGMAQKGRKQVEAQQWDSIVQVSSKLVKLPVLGDPRPLVKPLWFEIMVQISTKEQLPSENTEQWERRRWWWIIPKTL